MGFLDVLGSIVSGSESSFTISDWIKTGTAAFGLYSSYQSNKTANDIMEQAQSQNAQQYANTAANQKLISDLAKKNLAAIEGMTDKEAYARTAGIYNALLSGKEPQELEPFRSQFEEIDQATQAQLRDIDAGVLAAQRQVSSTIPNGGMKLRMLADIAMKAQDQKAAVMQRGRDAIRDKNMQLKNEYMNRAMGFGEAQPGNTSKVYESTAGILRGYPTAQTVTPNQMLVTSNTNAGGATQNLQTLGEEIGKLVDLPKPKQQTTSNPISWYEPPKTSAEVYGKNESYLDNY